MSDYGYDWTVPSVSDYSNNFPLTLGGGTDGVEISAQPPSYNASDALSAFGAVGNASVSLAHSFADIYGSLTGAKSQAEINRINGQIAVTKAQTDLNRATQLGRLQTAVGNNTDGIMMLLTVIGVGVAVMGILKK